MQTRQSNKRLRAEEPISEPGLSTSAADPSQVDMRPYSEEVRILAEEVIASLRGAADALEKAHVTEKVRSLSYLLSNPGCPFAVLSLGDNARLQGFIDINQAAPVDMSMDLNAAAAAVQQPPAAPNAMDVDEADRKVAPPLEKLTPWDTMDLSRVANEDIHEDKDEDNQGDIDLGDTYTLGGHEGDSSDSEDDPDGGREVNHPRRRSQRIRKVAKQKQEKEKTEKHGGKKKKKQEKKQETKTKESSEKGGRKNPGRPPTSDHLTAIAVLDKITRNPGMSLEAAAADLTKMRVENQMRLIGRPLSEEEERKCKFPVSTLRKRVPKLTGYVWSDLLITNDIAENALERIRQRFPDIYNEYMTENEAANIQIDGTDDANPTVDGLYNQTNQLDALGLPQRHQAILEEEEEEEEEVMEVEEQQIEEEVEEQPHEDEEEYKEDINDEDLVTIKRENCTTSHYYKQEQEQSGLSYPFDETSDKDNDDEDNDDENDEEKILLPIKQEQSQENDYYDELMFNSTVVPPPQGGAYASPMRCTRNAFLGTPPTCEESQLEESPRWMM